MFATAAQLLSLACRNIWSATCSLSSFINQWSVLFHLLRAAERGGVPYLSRLNLIFAIGPGGFVRPEAGHVSHPTTLCYPQRKINKYLHSFPGFGPNLIHVGKFDSFFSPLPALRKKGHNYLNGNSNSNGSESRSLGCKHGFFFPKESWPRKLVCAHNIKDVLWRRSSWTHMYWSDATLAA